VGKPKDTRAAVECAVCLGKAKGFQPVWAGHEILYLCPRCAAETIEEWSQRSERPPPWDGGDIDAGT
jgi:hypothetical protein